MSDQPDLLATDLDGTLIPLEGNLQNTEDLQRLKQECETEGFDICFVTGRHFESVLDAIETYHLPSPNWIICDVGTTVREKSETGFKMVDDYQNLLASRIDALPINELEKLLASVSHLRKQEDEKQGPFKLSYYIDEHLLPDAVNAIQTLLASASAPYSLIHSVDPFNRDGLIDLLPQGTSKASAIHWWSEYVDKPLPSILFAGDSGNDLAALTAGFKAIVVGNAESSLIEQVHAEHKASGWTDRLYVASGMATSGVLEGCLHYGLIPS